MPLVPGEPGTDFRHPPHGGAIRGRIPPYVTQHPGTQVVGRFLLTPDSIQDLGNEVCLQEVRRRAAAMGGNVIVYLHHGVDYAPVAYVPESPQENLHGNDDLACRED